MERAISSKEKDYDEIINYYRMKEKVTIKHKANKVKRNNSYLQINYFFYTIIMFMFCMIIIYNYANITQSKMEIKIISNEIIELEKEKEDILVSLESMKNSKIIEENAINYLGMNYASKNQRNYIQVDYNSVSFSKKDSNTDKGSYLTMFLDKTFNRLLNEGM